MPDRGNVKDGLRDLAEFLETKQNIAGVGKGAEIFGWWAFCVRETLRGQEPVEPDGENCGECGYTLHRINYDGPDKELRHEWFRFCPSCGKAVKWYD